MPARKKAPAQVISLDAFGSAKNYWVCWVSSPLSHLSFANRLQQHLGLPCTYIGDITLDDVHPKLAFPMYFATFNQDYDATVVVLANHVTAPMDISTEQQNPLLGGLLFEDDYYLFNNQGLKKIDFTPPQADYLLLLSADKQADITDYSEQLPLIPNIKVLCQDTPQLIAESQKKSKQVLDFLQYLFYESEAAVKEFRQRKLCQKLHHKMSVAEANYGYLRFPVESNRMITSSLLRREDL